MAEERAAKASTGGTQGLRRCFRACLNAVPQNLQPDPALQMTLARTAPQIAEYALSVPRQTPCGVESRTAF